MSPDFATPEPSSPFPGATATPAQPALESWIGDVLLACDAARAAGIMSGDIPSSPSGSAHDDGHHSAHQLALARACLDRLHRRWPWARLPGEKSSRESPLAGLNLTVGRYRLQNLIGSGGHGLVFLANDPTLQRNVALKIPRPEWLASDRHRRRFLREALALARLDHPGIVPIYEFGEAGSVCYLATAHVDGPNLAEWLALQPESPGPILAAKLLLSLAEAIAHAHARGVLHLDLKPANVLLEWCDDPIARIPRITDFGLATLLDETSDETRTDTLPFGTPRFMAPEQAARDRSRIGQTTDVYGLGAILDTILSGSDSPGPLHDTPSNVPSRPNLPQALRQILGRCLERSPADRYLTATALAEDLRRFIEGHPVTAPRLGRGKFRRAWDELKVSNRAFILSVLLLVGVLAVGGIIMADRARLPDGNPAVQRTPLETPAKRNAQLEPDPRGDRYTREMQNAYRLIHDNHDTGTADSKRLDHWAGPYPAGEPDPRRFEWGYLKNLAHRESLTFPHGDLPNGKPNAVYHVRFSPDGAKLVTAAKDGKARIWDSVSGRCLQVFDHNGIEVNSASFSPDGKSVVTASDDGYVRFWDAASGAAKRRLSPPHGGEANAALFTPDGTRLVSASRDGRLAVWNASTGAELWRRDADVGPIECLAIARDGSFAAAGGSRDGRIAILRLADFALRWHIRSGSGLIGLDIAPDNRFIAVNSLSDVVLVDTTARASETRLVGHRAGVESVAFAADQSILASVSGGEDHSIRIWEPATGRERDVMPGHTSASYFVTFSPDGKRLATASADGTAKLWELNRRTDRTHFQFPPGTTPLDFVASFESSSGSESERGSLTLVTITKDGRLIRLDGYDGHTLETRTLFHQTIVSARIAPLARSIAAVSADGMVVIADVAGDRTPEAVADIRVIPDSRSYAFDRQGRVLVAKASATTRKNLARTSAGPIAAENMIVIDTATRRVTSRLASLSDSFPTVNHTFFADGRRLAACNASGGDGLVVWDLADGQARVSPSPGKARRIVALAVSFDGKLLATGDVIDRIQLNDTETLAIAAELLEHRYDISSLAFSPDSRRLASGDVSGAVILWDVASGEKLLELEGLSDRVFYLEFAPDGRTLVGASLENGVRAIVWHGRTKKVSGTDSRQEHQRNK